MAGKDETGRRGRGPSIDAVARKLTEHAKREGVEVEWTAPDGTKIKITPAAVHTPLVQAEPKPIDAETRARALEAMQRRAQQHQYGASGLAPASVGPVPSMPIGPRS